MRGLPARVLVYTLAVSSLLACPALAESTFRAKNQAIVGGTPSAREAVVYIATNLDDDPVTEDRGCTGAVIAPNLVITARHCVSAFTEGTFSCTISGNIDEQHVRDPAGAGSVGLPYDPDWVRVLLGPRDALGIDKSSPDVLEIQRIFTVETDSICRNDVAIVQLSKSLDIPPLALRLDSGVRPRESTKLVGFGLNDDNDVAQHEVDGLRILGVGPSAFFPTDGQAPPRTFSVGEGPCPGDSGGPALSSETDAVLGVFSFFKGKCDSSTVYNYYTQVAPFAEFVRTVFEDVGAEISLEVSGVGGSSQVGEAGAPSALGGATSGGAAATPPRGSGGCSLGAVPTTARVQFLVWGGFIAAGSGRSMRRRRDEPRRG